MTVRRRLLGEEFWVRYLEPPSDEREIARLYAFGPDDLELIGSKRGDAKRLGCAMVLLYLRHPGRVLDAGELPPPALLA